MQPKYLDCFLYAKIIALMKVESQKKSGFFLRPRRWCLMEEEKDNIEFSANDLALIEALRKVKRKKRRRFIL